MSDYICLLLAVLHIGPMGGTSQLLRTALKIKRCDLPPETIEYPMEPDSRIILKGFLPLHAQGDIIEVTEIFEVHVHEQKKQ